MNGATMADLALLVPELILVGVALLIILGARRINETPIAGVATIIAALASAVFSVLALSDGDRTGFAGMLVVDGYSQFFKVLIAATLAITTLLSGKSMDDEQVPRAEYHALLLLAATGMMITASSVDLIPLYLGLELTTLCSYVLVGFTAYRATSTEAAIKYFLLASVASALLLYGISLTYGMTGTTDIAGVGAAISEHGLGSNTFLVVALALMMAGMAFKIAAVPFHAWAPDAYQGAMPPVAAYLATGAKAAGLAAIGRVGMVAFSEDATVLSAILVCLAFLSIVVGSVLALAQTDMKRLLAYSSIAHAGYAMLGLIAASSQGVSATMTYAFFYVFMTLGAFGVVIALGKRGATLDGYIGLASQRPAMAALMMLFMLSLTGIPLTSGFVAKFRVIENVVREGHFVLAILAVVCSVVSAFIYMRVVVFMYMREATEEAPPRFPKAVSVALALAALVTLVGGIVPESVLRWAVSP